MSTFSRRLAAVASAAAVVRVVLAVVAGFDAETTLSDSFNYHLLGEGLATGEGYVRAFDRVISDVRVPTAEFPPLFPALLAVLHIVGIDTVPGQEVALAVLGTATVVLVGCIGRDLAGERAGLAAAALAAVYPMLVLPDITLQAEGLYAALVAAVLLTTLRARRAPSLPGWLLVGALVGLATLARSEGLLLIPFVVGASVRDWRHLAIAVCATAAVLTPWFVRNLVALDHPVPLSNNSGTLLAGANCDDTYRGDRTGLWSYECTSAVPIDTRDETERTRRFTDAGLEYVSEHVTRLPAVVSVRVLRTFGVWRPAQQLHEEEAKEGRRFALLVAGHAAYLAVLAAAAYGVVQARRRAMRVGPLLGCILVVLVTSAITYGNQRFRIAAEPSFLVLAGIGITRMRGTTT